MSAKNLEVYDVTAFYGKFPSGPVSDPTSIADGGAGRVPWSPPALEDGERIVRIVLEEEYGKEAPILMLPAGARVIGEASFKYKWMRPGMEGFPWKCWGIYEGKEYLVAMKSGILQSSYKDYYVVVSGNGPWATLTPQSWFKKPAVVAALYPEVIELLSTHPEEWARATVETHAQWSAWGPPTNPPTLNQEMALQLWWHARHHKEIYVATPHMDHLQTPESLAAALGCIEAIAVQAMRRFHDRDGLTEALKPLGTFYHKVVVDHRDGRRGLPTLMSLINEARARF